MSARVEQSIRAALAEAPPICAKRRADWLAIPPSVRTNSIAIACKGCGATVGKWCVAPPEIPRCGLDVEQGDLPAAACGRDRGHAPPCASLAEIRTLELFPVAVSA